MKARFWSYGLICCLVIGLGLTLSVTSALGQVHQRDANYNGIWQDWGGGWQYIYYTAQDQAYWRQVGSNSRLSYQYTPGQWLDCDKFGTWRNIGASGVADWWIGDGNWHNLKNGWSYAYSASSNASYWSDASGQRLAYFYTPGQWWDIGKIGGWDILSGTDMTGAFIGDGVWHNLKNGWSYAYLASNDAGYWGTGLGQRFAYFYTPGQWWDIGKTGGWSTLSSTGVADAFVGDGGWHDLKNTWTYAYTTSLDCGYWAIGSNQRFAYDYWNTQWWDIGNTGGWWVLSGTGVSPDFVGDGNWHDIKNAGSPFNASWSYAYLKTLDAGSWSVGAGQRFAYDYANGQWWDIGNVGGWNVLSSTGVSCAFVGDQLGNHHLYLTGPNAGHWDYRYDYGSDTGYWYNMGSYLSGLDQFHYHYATGVWEDRSYYQTNTDTGLRNVGWTCENWWEGHYSSAFVGDGATHDLSYDGYGLQYQYYFNFQFDNSTVLHEVGVWTVPGDTYSPHLYDYRYKRLYYWDTIEQMWHLQADPSAPYGPWIIG